MAHAYAPLVRKRALALRLNGQPSQLVQYLLYEQVEIALHCGVLGKRSIRSCHHAVRYVHLSSV